MIGNTILVRPVQKSDAASLQLHCFISNTLEQVQDMIADNLQAQETGTICHLVAEVDGNAVGSATLIRDTHILRTHRAGLFGLVVSQQYQQRGIARRLVDALCEYATTMGISILETSCRVGTPAEKVYKPLGFVEWGRVPHGLLEPGANGNFYDEIYFYRMIADTYTESK